MGNLYTAINELGKIGQAKSFGESLYIAWYFMQKRPGSEDYYKLDPTYQEIVSNLFEAKERDTIERDRKEKLLAIASGSTDFDELSEKELLERVELLKDRDSKAENARPNLYLLVAKRRIKELKKRTSKTTCVFSRESISRNLSYR